MQTLPQSFSKRKPRLPLENDSTANRISSNFHDETSSKERLESDTRTVAYLDNSELDAKRTQRGETRCEERDNSVEQRTLEAVTHSARISSSTDEECPWKAKNDSGGVDVGTHPTLEELRERSRNNLKSAWESIFLRYGRDFEGECDEIDFSTETPTIVKDRGFIRRGPVREFGKMKLMCLEGDAKSNYVHVPPPPQIADDYACDPGLEGFFADGDENEGSETDDYGGDESGEDFKGCYDDDDFEHLLQFTDAKEKLAKAGREPLLWTEPVALVSPPSDSTTHILLQGELPQIKPSEDDPFREKVEVTGGSNDAPCITPPSPVTANRIYFGEVSHEEIRSKRCAQRRARSLSPTSFRSLSPPHFLPSPPLNAFNDPLKRQFHPTPIGKHKWRIPDYFTSIHRADISDQISLTDIASPTPPRISLSSELEKTDESCTYDSLLPPTPSSTSIPVHSVCENGLSYPMDTNTTATTQPDADISPETSPPDSDMEPLVPGSPQLPLVDAHSTNRTEIPLQLPLSEPIFEYPSTNADFDKEWDHAFKPLYLDRVMYDGDRCLDSVFSNCSHLERDPIPIMTDEEPEVVGDRDRTHGIDSDLDVEVRATIDKDPLGMISLMEDANVDQRWAEFERSSGLDYYKMDRRAAALSDHEMESRWNEFEKTQALEVESLSYLRCRFL